MKPGTPSIDDLRIERDREPRIGRAVLSLLVLILVVASGAAAAWWWTRERPVPVTVAVITRQRLGAGAAGAVLNASGYVTARRRATVSSKVTGKVVDVLVEEGMAVREGQVLAHLDPSTAGRYLTLSHSELDAAKRSMLETEVRLAQARVTLKRTQALVADGIVTTADLDAAQAEVDALDARLALAREQVTVSERQVSLRENDVNDLTITAPFAGVAISKDAQPGEMVSPVSAGGGFTRTGICTIVDMASLEIDVDVNEAYIGRVTPHQKVEATLDAYPDWRIPGAVITTVPTADRQKATVLVRIAFEPSTGSGSSRAGSRGDKLDPRILPDMGIKVAFLDSGPAADASRGPTPGLGDIVAPRAAIRQDGGRDIVFVVGQDERVERRALKLGPARDDGSVVLAGLEPGDRVVLDPPSALIAGTRVVVK